MPWIMISGLSPPSVMALLQRRMEGGLRQTLSVLLASAVSELAWERAKLHTGLLRWALRYRQRTGQLLTCTRPSCRTSALRFGDRSVSRILRRLQLWPQRQICELQGSLLTSTARVTIEKPVGSGQAGCRDRPPGSCAVG